VTSRGMLARKVTGMLRTELLTEENVAHDDEGLVVAAALAAALLEYRRHKGETATEELEPGGGARWRLMARLDQLQGTL
jgi:hypothetical protein